MFLFILLPALLILGMVLIAGPALLPFGVIAAVAFVVTRVVIQHRHPEQSVHPH